MNDTKTKKLIESAVMIALATALSLIKIVDLPYGGSITIASMLPIAIISYRHGLGWGFSSGAVYGIIQQLLGLKTLSYVTTWQSVVAVILLDYVLAFAVIGISGIFRKAVKDQAAALTLGALLSCLLRYVFHVISGATVWAGLSIPTTAALTYSFIYNATYMLPETIITAMCAFYIGSTVNLRSELPTRKIRERSSRASSIVAAVALLLITAAVVFDVCEIFAHLQNPETGTFTWSLTGEINFTAIVAITVAAVVAAIMLFAVRGAIIAGSERLSCTLSLIFNLSIVYFTVYCICNLFSPAALSDENTLSVAGVNCLKYFTVLSNIYVAAAALIIVILRIRNITRGKHTLPAWAHALKFSSTVSVSVTFLTVALFIAPFASNAENGYFSYFTGNNFFMHFLTPILAVVSFIFFEKGRKFPFRYTVFGLIPVVLYSALYFVMVMVVGSWQDFYGFTFGGNYWTVPIVMLFMYAATYGVSVLERILNKLFVRYFENLSS